VGISKIALRTACVQETKDMDSASFVNTNEPGLPMDTKSSSLAVHAAILGLAGVADQKMTKFSAVGGVLWETRHALSPPLARGPKAHSPSQT